MPDLNPTAPVRAAAWDRPLLPWLALLIAVFALGRGVPWVMDRPAEPPTGPAGPGELGNENGPVISLEQKRKDTEDSATSISRDFNDAPTEYHLLVAIVSNGDAATVSAPTGWSTAISETNNTPGQAIFYKIAGASESSTVTISGYSVATRLALQIFEYSGIESINPALDQTSSTSGTGTAVSSGSVTTTVADALMLAAVISNTGVESEYEPWSNSFNERHDEKTGSGTVSQVAMADLTASSTGSYSTVGTNGTSGAWRGQIVAFKQTSVPTPVDDAVVITGNAQNRLVWDLPTETVTHIMVLARPTDCSFSGTPDGPEAKGTVVGNATVIFNDDPTVTLASTAVTVAAESTTVEYSSVTSRLTHASLTNGTFYCYKILARYGAEIDDDSGAGQPEMSGTPTAGSGTDPTWVFGSATSSLSAPSLLSNVGVFYANNSGRVFGVASSDGDEQFRPYTTSDAIQGRSSVGTLSGDTESTLFASSLNGDVYAIWATGGSKGTLRWSTEGIDGDNVTVADQALGDDIQAAALVSNSLTRVFIATRNSGSNENRVFSVNATTGACVWVYNGTCAGTTTTENLGYIANQPIHDATSKRLLFSSKKIGSGNTIWALDSNDSPAGSRLLWGRNIGSSEASPAFGVVARSSIYTSTTSGEIYKLNASDGTTCWGSTTDGCGSATGSEEFFCTDPLVEARATSCSAGSAINVGHFVIFVGPYQGHAVFSTADGTVRMINASGVQQWKRAVSGASFPLVLTEVGGGKVYVGGSDGSVHQLVLATGVEDATRDVGGGSVVVGDPAYDDQASKLYVSTSQGKLHAFSVPF